MTPNEWEPFLPELRRLYLEEHKTVSFLVKHFEDTHQRRVTYVSLI